MADLDLAVGRAVVVLLLRQRHARRRQQGGGRCASQKSTPVGFHFILRRLSLRGTSLADGAHAAKKKAAKRRPFPSSRLHWRSGALGRHDVAEQVPALALEA